MATPLDQALSESSTLIDRAFARALESLLPRQRVPRRSKDAVVVGSEVDRLKRPKSSRSLVNFFLRTVGEAELVDAMGYRSSTADECPFGADFADRMLLCDASIVSLFDA